MLLITGKIEGNIQSKVEFYMVKDGRVLSTPIYSPVPAIFFLIASMSVASCFLFC